MTTTKIITFFLFIILTSIFTYTTVFASTPLSVTFTQSGNSRTCFATYTQSSKTVTAKVYYHITSNKVDIDSITINQSASLPYYNEGTYSGGQYEGASHASIIAIGLFGKDIPFWPDEHYGHNILFALTASNCSATGSWYNR